MRHRVRLGMSMKIVLRLGACIMGLGLCCAVAVAKNPEKVSNGKDRRRPNSTERCCCGSSIPMVRSFLTK